MSLQSLPAEVLVAIAGHLPQRRDVAALLACCRACWVLQDRTQVLLPLWLARQHVEAGSPLGSLLSRIPCSATIAAQLQSLLHPIQLWSPQHPLPPATPPHPNHPNHHSQHHHPNQQPQQQQQAQWFRQHFIDNDTAHPPHPPCTRLIHWLSAWAAEQGRADLVAWALCIDPETQLSTSSSSSTDLAAGVTPRYTTPAAYVFPDALQPFPFAPSTTLLHAKMFMMFDHRLQDAATSALAMAAACGQLQVARLLMDHSVAQVEVAMGILAQANHAASLRMLLLPRHPTSSGGGGHKPTDLRQLWQALSAPPPTHPLSHVRGVLEARAAAAGAAQPAGPSTAQAGASTSNQASQQPAVQQGEEEGEQQGALQQTDGAAGGSGSGVAGGSQGQAGAAKAGASAAAGGSTEPAAAAVRVLWGLGAPLHLAQTTALPRAAHSGALTAVQALLDLGVNPVVGLHAAGEGGSVVVLRLLLSACQAGGHSPNHLVLLASGALTPAASSGHITAVRFLLDRGAEAALDNHQALTSACSMGHTEVVGILLDAGSPVAANQGAALAVAALAGREEVVRLLLRRGADPNLPPGRPLSSASFNGHTAIIKMLLEAGANAHHNDEEALSQAAHNGHISAARAILEYCCRAQVEALRAQHEQQLQDDIAFDHDSDSGSGDGSDDDHDDDMSLPPTGADMMQQHQQHLQQHQLGNAGGPQHRQHQQLGSTAAAAAAAGTSASQAAHASGSRASGSEASGVQLGGEAAQQQQQPSSYWPRSKLPLLAELLAACPNCPNRSCPVLTHVPHVHDSSMTGDDDDDDDDATMAQEDMVSLPPAQEDINHHHMPGEGAAGVAQDKAAQPADHSDDPRHPHHHPHHPHHPHHHPQPHHHHPSRDHHHSRCPSTRQLWQAARAELAALSTRMFSWYSIFCDGCGSLPITGRRWRCRDCPRYFLELQPALQGYDLCDACQLLEAEGQPLPHAFPHPTHVPLQHTICMDLPPREFTDLDNHAHMLVWLNCYEALHPEVPAQQLHHLAVMHVNKDPRRTRITTGNLIELLAPGTTPEYWQDLLPPLEPTHTAACASGSTRAEVCVQCRQGQALCCHMDQALALNNASGSGGPTTSTPSGRLSGGAGGAGTGGSGGAGADGGGGAGGSGGGNTMAAVGGGGGGGHDDNGGGGDMNDNAWPTMPPPGFVPPQPVAYLPAPVALVLAMQEVQQAAQQGGLVEDEEGGGGMGLAGLGVLLVQGQGQGAVQQGNAMVVDHQLQDL